MNFGLLKNEKSAILAITVKVIFLLALIVGVPYVFLTVSLKYQDKASGIVEQQNTIIEIQSEKSNEIKILTQVEATTLARIHDTISGTWLSEQDGKYKLEIDSNNKFEEYYDGIKEGFGVWQVFSKATAVDDGATNNTDGKNDSTSAEKPEDVKYFLKKEQYEQKHLKEVYLYEIQQLDTEKFVLVFKNGTGKPLLFIKATSTPQNE